MRWLLYSRLLVLCIIVIGVLVNPISISATSWIKLKPAEVNQRAEVVVLGRYDFSQHSLKKQSSSGIFSPIPFKVDKYYRGSGSGTLTVGIDLFDIGWVKEAQEANRYFLLFLEKDTAKKDFLVPVAGPNGMIQVVNNTARTGNKDEETYYNTILQGSSTVTQVVPLQSIPPAYIIGILLMIIAGFIWVVKQRKSGSKEYFSNRNRKIKYSVSLFKWIKDIKYYKGK